MNSFAALPAERRRLELRGLLILIAGIAVWFAFCEIATQAWYAWQESRVPRTAPWMVSWPTSADAANRGFEDFQSREMSGQEKEILRFQAGNAANWRAAGVSWSGFFIQWPSDHRLNQMDLIHNPTVCLSGAGLTLLRSLPQVVVSAGNLEIRFLAWEFSAQGQHVYVYVATRWERDFRMFSYRQGSLQMRLGNFARVLDGNRGNPLQTLELVTIGPRTPEEADAALREQVAKLFVERG